MDSTFLAKQDFTTQELQILAGELDKNKKSASASWLLFLLFGSFGVHRFYLGNPFIGLAMLGTLFFSLIFFMIPLIAFLFIELILLSTSIRKANERIEKEIIEKIILMRHAKKNDVNNV